MTTSPDSISMDSPKKWSDLELLKLAYALDEESEREELLYDGFTQTDVCRIASEAKQAVFKKCSDPMVHKVLALSILQSMITYHEEMSQDILQLATDDEGRDLALNWAEDIGKLKYSYEILRNVSLGKDDFTTGESE